MTSDGCKFEILECRLLSINFDLNKALAPEAQAEVNIKLNMEHVYDDKDNILCLTMGFDITGKDFDMNVSVKHQGIFKFNKKPSTEEHLSKTAEITCAAILFPFLRETIADLTRRAGLPPLILNPLNLIDLYHANHPKAPTVT